MLVNHLSVDYGVNNFSLENPLFGMRLGKELSISNSVSALIPVISLALAFAMRAWPPLWLRKI